VSIKCYPSGILKWRSPKKISETLTGGWRQAAGGRSGSCTFNVRGINISRGAHCQELGEIQVREVYWGKPGETAAIGKFGRNQQDDVKMSSGDHFSG